jgi:DNA-binding transcriptional MerR regulator
MSNDDMEIIGKQVKDMYGTSMGKVVGTITDIDGSIQTVGVDCGSQGLQQIPYEQLVTQGDTVIFIPKWRLESQRLLREKGLTLRRLKALMDIVSENDEMRDDAAIINEKYKSQLISFEEAEKEINAKLEIRLGELDEQMKAVKMLVFDAKVQFKSNEISESMFESVKTHTTDLIEHITHENAEISNVQRRITDLNMEVQKTLEAPAKHLQDSAVTYLDVQSDVESKLPEAPTQIPMPEPPEPESTTSIPEPPEQVTPISAEQPSEQPPEQSDWLARMEAS